MRGLDPRIPHKASNCFNAMDCRVKPGNDEGQGEFRMDVLILIGSFTVVCLLGMPVAYALGLAAILAALWVGIPLEAVMLKVSGGMSGFSLLAIPFFIL